MLIRAIALLTLALAGCGPGLPEETTPAARVYARRCGECHRAYAPGTMTWPMWEYQLGRMKILFARLHRPWLAPEEERLLVDYLRRHAGTPS